MDDIVFRIGGRDWSCPPMVFARLRKAWPHISALSEETEFMERIWIGLHIIAIGLSAATAIENRPSSGELADMLLPDEILGIDPALAALIEASMPPVPKALSAGEAEAASSPGTSPALSPNSPPEVSAEATPGPSSPA